MCCTVIMHSPFGNVTGKEMFPWTVWLQGGSVQKLKKKSKRSGDSYSSILCLILLMCVATMHCLNNSGQESKIQFAVYNSDIPVTLKKIKGHLTQYELLDPKQVIIMQSLKDLP